MRQDSSADSQIDPETEAQVLQVIEELDAACRQNPSSLVKQRSQNPRRWTTADAEQLVEHYRNLAKQFPVISSKAGDWGEPGEQRRVLQDLTQVGNLHHQRVLELGCGDGSLLSFFAKKNIVPLEYLGIDICTEAIAKARQHFPTAKFCVADCFEEGVGLSFLGGREFDYTIASGLFGVRPQQWTADEFNALILRVIGRILDVSHSGFAFNVIPANYSVLRKILELKADTEPIAYHRIDRLELIRACEDLHCQVKELPRTLQRLMVQFSLLLYPSKTT